MNAKQQAIGFIGLGVMGSRMATRLVEAGYSVTVHDKNPAAQAKLVGRGGQPARSAREVGDRTDVVLLSLGMPAHVKEVAFGADGLVHGTRAKIVADLSTTGSVMEKAIAAELSLKGITLIDAPVSGGSHGAEAGTLAIMCSGPQAQFRAAEPVLQNIGKLFYLGTESGCGQTMKLINNMVGAACTIASFEAMVFGTKAGLDPQTMLDVLTAGAGMNIGTLHKIPKCVLPRTFPQLFTTDLMFKDVKLGAEEAEALGAPLWVLNSARQFLSFAVSQGDGPLDWANGIKHFERWANVVVAAKPEASKGG